MYKNFKNIIFLYIMSILYSSIALAGSANLTIIHENQDLKVVKYIIKYGLTEQIDPNGYQTTVEVEPNAGPVAVKSITRVDLGNGKSGQFYFSVKDVYSDGSSSEFSESSFPISVPKKPLNLKIK